MFSTVLVPLDGTPDAEKAIEAVKVIDRQFLSRVVLLLVSPSADSLVSTLAETFGASGTALAAGERSEVAHDIGEAYLRAVVEAQGDDSWTSIVRPGHTVDVIREVAAETGADLVVMASHRRSGFSRILMGSVAEDVLRHVHVPLLVIPIEEHDD